MGFKRQTVIIFGEGYVGKAFRKALENQYTVLGTKRKHINATTLQQVWNETSAHLDIDAENIVGCLYTIPPQPNNDALLQKTLKTVSGFKNLRWFGYLSSTAVYGDHHGLWVNEKSLLAPSTPRGQKRLKSERHCLAFARVKECAVTIYRLAGIYGPGRSVFERFDQTDFQNIYAPQSVFSRIHLEDIIRLLTLSFKRSSWSSIYNLADQYPTASYMPTEYGFSLAKKALPARLKLKDADMSEAMKSFYCERKKVNGVKILNHLQTALKFPTYQEGLQHIYEKLETLKK